MESKQKTVSPDGKFERPIKSRHLIMMSIGGVIGTGLFFNTGLVISQAGAFGTILAYSFGALLVWMVMQSLGELSVHLPYTGSFHLYAEKFIAPWAGVAVAWFYWINWAMALGASVLAAGLAMQFWFPGIPVSVFTLAFILLLIAMNVFTARLFAEGEFWLAMVKVVVISAFIVLGLCGIFGAIPLSGGEPAPGLGHLTENGLFPAGALPILIAMVNVIFSYSGTELIGVAAGETENPQKVIPVAIRSTVFRLAVFYIGTVLVLACMIPMAEAGVTKSPFVVVFEKIGIPWTADIMNFVVLTSVVSAANSGLYAASRMIWSLAHEGVLPRVLAQQNARGVPSVAVVVTMLGSLVALFSEKFAADTVYLVLTALSGLATLVVWASVCWAHLVFRRAWLAEGKTLAELKYRAPFTPALPILGIVLCFVACIGIWLDPEQRIAILCGVPFILLCYFCYRKRPMSEFTKNTKF